MSNPVYYIKTYNELINDIMNKADHFSRNHRLSISEMNTFLRNTEYDELLTWLFVNDKYNWRKYDKNNSGALSKRELKKALKEFIKMVKDKKKKEYEKTFKTHLNPFDLTVQKYKIKNYKNSTQDTNYKDTKTHNLETVIWSDELCNKTPSLPNTPINFDNNTSIQMNPLSKKRKLPPIQFPNEKKSKLDQFKTYKQRQTHNEHNNYKTFYSFERYLVSLVCLILIILICLLINYVISNSSTNNVTNNFNNSINNTVINTVVKPLNNTLNTTYICSTYNATSYGMWKIIQYCNNTCNTDGHLIYTRNYYINNTICNEVKKLNCKFSYILYSNSYDYTDNMLKYFYDFEAHQLDEFDNEGNKNLELHVDYCTINNIIKNKTILSSNLYSLVNMKCGNCYSNIFQEDDYDKGCLTCHI